MVDYHRSNKHDYDIIEDPMADDMIWKCVEDFMSGDIFRNVF